jgi:hypothetical protein
MSRGWQYTWVECSSERTPFLNRPKSVFKMYDPARRSFDSIQPQPKTVIDMLNGLGRQGWELVTITVLVTRTISKDGEPDIQEPLRTAWYFKRPIPE